jgi:hypothetical protein
MKIVYVGGKIRNKIVYVRGKIIEITRGSVA